MNTAKQIDPIQLANQQAKLADTVSLSVMSRLGELLVQDGGEVQFQLQFDKDPQGRYIMTGHIQATLCFSCQRCGEPVALDLEAYPKLCILISEDQMSQCSEPFEPLITKGEVVSLVELIENELLLAMPMAPKHPEKHCPKKLPDYLR